MQIDPVKPKLKPPGTKRLKLKYDEPLSKFAFKFNLRRYIKASIAIPDLQKEFAGTGPSLATAAGGDVRPPAGVYARGAYTIATALEISTAAVGAGGARAVKRIEQAVEELGVKPPTVSTRAVCAAWLALRAEAMAGIMQTSFSCFSCFSSHVIGLVIDPRLLSKVPPHDVTSGSHWALSDGAAAAAQTAGAAAGGVGGRGAGRGGRGGGGARGGGGRTGVPQGVAVQLAPMKSVLKPPRTKHLKLKRDILLSNSAYNSTCAAASRTACRTRHAVGGTRRWLWGRTDSPSGSGRRSGITSARRRRGTRRRRLRRRAGRRTSARSVRASTHGTKPR